MTEFDHGSYADSDQRLAPLGRGLFGAGIALLILRGLDLATRMPGLPSFWYANQPLWIATSFGLMGLGWQILWRSPRPASQSWRPSVPGRRFRTAELYIREGCHLCDDAAAILHAHGQWLPDFEELDIDSDPTLLEKFNTCVPVVVLDGKVRFRGRIDETLLRRLIEGTAAAAAAAR